MKHLSLNTKLWFALGMTWLGLLALGVWATFELRTTMVADRKITIQNVVEAAYGVVDEYAKSVEKGTLSLSDAQHEAMAKLSAMHYGTDGFMVITNSKPTVLMHGRVAGLQGKDVSDYKDSSGKRLFDEMVEIAQNKGEGYVDYQAYVPSTGGSVPKTTFVKRFVPWDWYLSSGLYMNDIDAAFEANLVEYLVVVLFIAVVVTVPLLAILRNIKRSLGGDPDYAANIATSIADGELRMDICLAAKDQNSMMYSMRNMQGMLTATVKRIHERSDIILSAAKEIASGNQDLSARTEEQAAALAETAASMEELTATVRQTAESAQQANELGISAAKVAGEGGNVVRQVVDTMQSIAASSERIAHIISLIEGIAFQTNILALNAAVEAARAGEQGRGFAVVAGEVRNLASRSADAAREIKALIADSVGQVGIGSTLVDRAASTMSSVVHAVQRVTSVIEEISTVADEQSKGIEQINVAISQMDQTTQRNAAMVEESAAAAHSLAAQAHDLKESVSVFRV